MKKTFNYYWSKLGTLVILLLIVSVLGILSPRNFLTGNNMIQILLQSSITVITACGQFFAILIAGIDLSVGSSVALTGMVTAKLLVAGLEPVLAILIGGIILGALLGLINGGIVCLTKLHPFIITLGTQAIFRGVTLIISDATSEYKFAQDFRNLISHRIGGFLPVPIIVALLFALILWLITTYTKMGRNLYALGGNAQAAWYSGINVNLHKLIVFVIAGIAFGIAGVVTTGRVGAAEPLAGTGFETFAIASVIIGGASFFGGKGSVFGVVIGGIIIGVISNGLTILNVPTYYQQVVMGSLIIISVTIDRFVSTRKTAIKCA